MNILVLTNSGKVVMRPDTSWERLNSDFYVPDFVSSLKYSPVFFARISRPGKAIGQSFASRYYDALGLGLLLYPADFLDGSMEGYAEACCLSHSSYLPIEMIDKEAFTPAEFAININGNKSFVTDNLSIEMIEKSICRVSEISLVRKGDLVAIELEGMMNLASEDSSVSIVNPWLGVSKFELKF